MACNNQVEMQADQNPTGQKAEIFPVKSFFEGQVHIVDSLKLPVYKYTLIGNKADSILISLAEFKALVIEFIEPDITGPSLSRYYTETSFADQSIPSVTLTYSTSEKNLEVQRMDVVINPNPVFDDKVKSIYMEKISQRKDTSILKKLYWKTNKHFQIITLTQSGDQQASVSQLKVEWDNFN